MPQAHQRVATVCVYAAGRAPGGGGTKLKGRPSPKSDSLAMPVCDSRQLEGFTSRCMMPAGNEAQRERDLVSMLL